MRKKICLAILIALMGLGGCRNAWEQNSEDDQDRAHEVLVTALDAWKEGKLATLAKYDPPIRFGDDDQQSGLQLKDYEFTDPDAAIHPFRDVGVRLTLLDQSGKTFKKPVTYQVGLDPNVTVLRSDN